MVTTDSTLMISASVLLHKEADYYLISVGASQEAPTVIDCNKQLNHRLENLINALIKLGIDEKKIYMDFISQTRIYDHKVEGNNIEEFFVGFEIRKNLIIKTKRLDQIDRIIELCSEQAVYDIIKVEYFNEHIEKIYEELFDQVINLIERKKARFLNHSSIKLTNKYRITSDNFQIYYPKNLYQEYKEAFESSTVNTYYSSNYIKKEVRKDRTFYYDGVATHLGADQIIDDLSPEVGIQYLLNVGVLYELEEE